MRSFAKIVAVLFAFGFATVFAQPDASAGTCSQGRQLDFFSWSTKSKQTGPDPLTIVPPASYSFSPFGTFEATGCSGPNCPFYRFSQIASPGPNEYQGTFLFAGHDYVIELASPSTFKAIELGLVHFSNPGIEWELLDKNGNLLAQGKEGKGRTVPEGVEYNESWTSGFISKNAHYLVVRGVQLEQAITKVCTRY